MSGPNSQHQHSPDQPMGLNMGHEYKEVQEDVTENLDGVRGNKHKQIADLMHIDNAQ